MVYVIFFIFFLQLISSFSLPTKLLIDLCFGIAILNIHIYMCTHMYIFICKYTFSRTLCTQPNHNFLFWVLGLFFFFLVFLATLHGRQNFSFSTSDGTCASNSGKCRVLTTGLAAKFLIFCSFNTPLNA